MVGQAKNCDRVRKFWMVLVVIVIFSGTLRAQKYGTTLGVRLGNDRYRTLGLTMEQRLLKKVTFEGILQSDFNSNTTAHALIKRHHSLLTKRLNLFGGVGFSMGSEESIRKDPDTREIITTYGNATMGADLIVGAELTLLGYNVSLDYKPNFNLTGRDNWYQSQVGISVRTVLIKDKERKKNKRKREREKKKLERKKKKEKS